MRENYVRDYEKAAIVCLFSMYLHSLKRKRMTVFHSQSEVAIVGETRSDFIGFFQFFAAFKRIIENSCLLW